MEIIKTLYLGGNNRKLKSKRKSKNNTKNKKIMYKRQKGKYTKKAGNPDLGNCYIIDLPNNNIKLNLGRRRYYTKNFNNKAKNFIINIANNPTRKNKCIKYAKILDTRLKIRKKHNTMKFRRY